MRHYRVMHERADQIVLEYLRRVGDVAHRVLRSDERLDFMTRLRARIEEIRAQTGAVEPEQVRRVIARFGDPARLVERERQRLEQERAPQQEAETETTIARAAVNGTAPGSESSTQPIPVVADSTQPAEATERTEASATEASGAETAQTETQGSTAGTREGPTPVTGSPGAPPAATPRRPSGAAGSPGPGGVARPPYEGPPTYEETTSSRALPGMPGMGTTMSAIDWRALVQENRLETAAIALLGLGGLFVPLPYALVPWLIGGGCVLIAGAWSVRDKLLAVAAPVALFVLGVFVVGAATRSERVMIDLAAYGAALTGYGATFIRVGALVGAGYLTWRLIRVAVGREEPPSPPGARPGWRRDRPWSR
ncbi:MAG: hypothetical protein GEV03_23740 [Streptosporangiales bacterium]|nr:hypothetical protein [Streptosporangiales bacterium]